MNYYCLSYCKIPVLVVHLLIAWRGFTNASYLWPQARWEIKVDSSSTWVTTVGNKLDQMRQRRGNRHALKVTLRIWSFSHTRMTCARMLRLTFHWAQWLPWCCAGSTCSPHSSTVWPAGPSARRCWDNSSHRDLQQRTWDPPAQQYLDKMQTHYR